MSGARGPLDVDVEVLGPDTPVEVAAEVAGIIRAAFAARPALDPPGAALQETPGSVAAALAGAGAGAGAGGLLARVGGVPVGAVLLRQEAEAGAGTMVLRRVGVLPGARRRGVAEALARAAEDLAARRGLGRVRVEARTELPDTVRLWARRGYAEVERRGTTLQLAKALPVELDVPTADGMRALGNRLGGLLRAGDLLILSGDLGAGKTTLTQGLGSGLGVRGDITSPTFVISRVHPSLVGGPALVHVDAYRLGGLAELDDLDLDVSTDDSVTVVEWGEGLAEALAEDRLEVTVTRAAGASGDERRRVRVVPVGARWARSGLVGVVA